VNVPIIVPGRRVLDKLRVQVGHAGAKFRVYTDAVADDRLVYSTDGRQRQDLREQRDAAPKRTLTGRGAGRAKTAPSVPNDGVVRIFRERGGRGGKVVTVVRGLPERGSALDALAGELKRLCGAGGAVKDRTVEVQGDHRNRIAERLRSKGYAVTLAGG
jgi:translation initiation factor 1